jgi:membrane-associated protein
VLDAITAWAEALMGLQWIYLIILGTAIVDSFLPLIPSESLIIAGGAFAATQNAPDLWLLVVAGACGAWIGDNISYGIGRWQTGPVVRWSLRGAKRERSYRWARHHIRRRGGTVLILARYLPAGRTATTMTMGVVRWSHRRFMAFDAIAVSAWSLQAGLLGYLGGRVFQDNPLLATVLGIGMAFVLVAVIELIRRVRGRRQDPAGVPVA